MKLYDINKKLENFMEDMDQEKDMEELQEEFIKLEEKKEDKIDNTIKYIRNIESDVAWLDKEIKRLSKLKKRKKNKIKSLTKFLDFIQEWEEIEVGSGSIKYRTSHRTIVSKDFDNEEYMRVRTTKRPDKKKIKEALKQGKKIDWVTIKEFKNIQIK